MAVDYYSGNSGNPTGLLAGFQRGQDRQQALAAQQLQMQREQQELDRGSASDQGDILYSQALAALSQQQMGQQGSQMPPAQAPMPGQQSQPMQQGPNGQMMPPAPPPQAIPPQGGMPGLPAGAVPPVSAAALAPQGGQPAGPTQAAPQPNISQINPVPSAQGQSGQGQYTWQQIFEALKKSNPNANPLAVAKAVDKFQGVMTQQSALEWKQQTAMLGIQAREQIAGQNNDTRLQVADKQQAGAGARTAATNSTRTQIAAQAEQGRNDRLALAQKALDNRQITKQQFDAIQNGMKAEAQVEAAAVRDDSDTGTQRGNAAVQQLRNDRGNPTPRAPVGAAPAARLTNAAMPKFSSPDDPGYQALPKGTQFMDGDGNVRTKQ